MEGTKMKRITIIAAAAALAISSLCSYAQDKNSAHQFIRIPRDPATGAMAGAGSASTFTTSYSAFRNSAVIPFSDKTVDVGVSYQMWAPDGVKSNDVAAGVAYKVSDKFGFSVGFAYDMGAEMQTFDASGKSSGKFSPSDMMINAGLGFAFTEKIGAGVNVRYSSDKIADGVTSNGFGADVFVLYKALPELNLTAGVSSFGSSVKDASGAAVSVSPDGDNRWVCPYPENAGLRGQYSDGILKLAQRIAKFTSQDLSQESMLNNVAAGSPAETTIKKFNNGWAPTHKEESYENMTVSNFYVLSDNCLTCHVSFDYILTSKRGNDYTYPTEYTFCILRGTDGGKLYNLVFH